MFGKSKEELEGNLLSMVYTPDKREHIQSQHQVRFRTRKIKTNFEQEVSVWNDKKIWIQVSNSFLDIPGEEPLLLGVFTNISEAKKAEEELKKSNQFNKSLLKSIPFGMDIVDQEGNVLFVSEKLKSHFGEISIGTKCWDLFVDDKTQCDDCPIKNEIRVGETYFIETNKLLKGQTFLITHTGILYEGQKAILEIFQDITNRKQAEKKVQTLSMAIEQNPASIVIANPDGEIEYVNPKFCEITGYTLEEAIGNNPRMLSSGEKKLEEYEELWNIITSGNTWFGEFHNKKKDGSLYWESASISPIFNDKGEITNYVAVKEDITEKRNMISDLVVAKKNAEKADKMKSIFLAQMSHEIRTPINSIVGMSSLIKMDFEDVADEEQLQSFEIVNRAGERIIRTIDLLINISEVQAGTYEPSPSLVDIHVEIIVPIIAENKKLAEKKNIDFSFSIATDDTTIMADSYTVTQIFTQLIDNALKYTEKGEVRVNIRKNRKDKLVVEIEDTGIGIEDKYLPELFEPFSQEEMGYTRKFEGNGIGLALVKIYCKLNNATIEVDSMKGIGSTFRVIFS